MGEVVNYHTEVSCRGGERPVRKGMLRRVRCIVSADGGAAAVEMALVLPFLMVTLMGIIEFGRVLYSHQVITNAAREASRAHLPGQHNYGWRQWPEILQYY